MPSRAYLKTIIVATAAMLAAIASPAAVSAQSMSTNRTTLQKAIAARRDVYGEAAMRQPNGPSYEFFADLIPPIRYARLAGFEHYPLVLGMSGGAFKARLVSNGSAINARGKAPEWLDTGSPVTFSMGNGAVFGADLAQLDGPRYSLGYLPIVETVYREGDTAYREEVFAGVSAPFGESAACFVRFSLADGRSGKIVAKIGAEGEIAQAGSLLTDPAAKALVWFSGNCKWDPKAREIGVQLRAGQDAYLVIFTQPAEFRPKGSLSAADYQGERAKCAGYWEAKLNTGCLVQTPEPRVNQCLNALQIGTMLLRRGDTIFYSSTNVYQALCEAECTDSALSLLLFGHEKTTREVLPTLMQYLQPGIEFHDSAFKLQTLSRFYWLTRDADFIRSQKPHWTAALDRIMKGRDPKTGLLPREDYCGDIKTPIYSLNANANSWRGLRDFAVVLEEIGEKDLAARVSNEARDYRKFILDAVQKSVRKDVSPPFMPLALFGEEEPYQAITETRMGSYWDLMIPYVLGSGVLGDDSEQTGWVLDYLHKRGGIFMGMIRFHESTTDDLYGLRYVLTLLRRDEVDRALVSFYGKMAQGLTHDTYIGGERIALNPTTPFGRWEDQPPNSSSNALWLWNLRYLMVQDWDINDDGRPDTLRLMFAAPQRWLEDGKTVRVQQMPTAFGPVSISMTSHVAQGEVIAEVALPTHAPEHTLLRARVPDGLVVTSAEIAGKALAADDRGTVDISGLEGKIAVRFSVKTRE